MGTLLLFLLALVVVGLLLHALEESEHQSLQPRERRVRQSVLYRTRDGRSYYSFTVQQQRDGSFRSYIVSQPNYRGRPTDMASTHRHVDEHGHSYVCWSAPLRSANEALQVSAAWADATQEYIESGRQF